LYSKLAPDERVASPPQRSVPLTADSATPPSTLHPENEPTALHEPEGGASFVRNTTRPLAGSSSGVPPADATSATSWSTRAARAVPVSEASSETNAS
jgi:hypothetical protein